MQSLVARLDDSALALDLADLGGGARLALVEGDDDRDLLLYACRGSGSVVVGGETGRLATGDAAFAPAGESVSLEAGPEGLAALCAWAGPSTDRHAPLGAREVVVPRAGAESDRATGARSFEILLGPHNGSTRATLFVGHVPPGKAPWHYHLYDEIVWIPDGPGRLHVAERVDDLGPGAAFRLRPREVHIVENASEDETMSLVGIFTPAGSPSAAYLTPDVAAEYRFAG